MVRTEELDELLRDPGDVIGNDDSKIGSIGQVFVDDQTGQPEWVTVKTGLFGRAESFVPLHEARVDGHDVRVPFDKDKIKDAPRVEDDRGHISEKEEAELYRYYAGSGGGGGERNEDDQRNADSPDDDGTSAFAGQQQSGSGQAGQSGQFDPTGGQSGQSGQFGQSEQNDDDMARSPDQRDVSTGPMEPGNVRLHRYVVTEVVAVEHDDPSQQQRTG